MSAVPRKPKEETVDFFSERRATLVGILVTAIVVISFMGGALAFAGLAFEIVEQRGSAKVDP